LVENLLGVRNTPSSQKISLFVGTFHGANSGYQFFVELQVDFVTVTFFIGGGILALERMLFCNLHSRGASFGAKS
jgi:hypothetical protein